MVFRRARFFGVDSNGTFNSTDTLKLKLASGTGLTGFGDIYSQGVVTIAGFTSDPVFSAGASPVVNGAFYSGGVETINLAWDNGTAYNYSFANAAASAGQTLTLSLDANQGPQLALTGIDYAAVPEPVTPPLLVLGGLGLAAVRRRLFP